MIPIRDINPSRVTPFVCYSIIGLCVFAFFYELALGRNLGIFLLQYGLVPVRYSVPDVAVHFTVYEQILPFFTSMFLHGGWLHLIGNMWVLYIFGDNVEGYLGHASFLLFYVLSGIIAALVHLFTNLGSSVPTIGASGAIAGVMGAYFILYPGARILAIIPIFFILYPVEVPAVVFLGFWFILQFFSGAAAVVDRARDFSGIAWWAHVGGFLGGIMLLSLFKPSRPKPRRTIYPRY